MAGKGEQRSADNSESTTDTTSTSTGTAGPTLVPVTGLIYRLKDGRVESAPAENWSFEMRLGLGDDNIMSNFVSRLQRGFGIKDRCDELGINSFHIKLANKDPSASQNFPRGRMYNNDSQETWKDALPD